MYFFLERVQQAFVYVKYGVALLLAITGLKMLLTIWHVEVPIPAALGIIVIILAGSVLASITAGNKKKVLRNNLKGDEN